MKHLLALFLLSMLLQPSGLQACAMDAEQSPGHHTAMPDSHESDCCEAQPDQSNDGCDAQTPCGFVSTIAPAIPAASGLALAAPDRQFALPDDGRYSGPPAPPLFKPPIA